MVDTDWREILSFSQRELKQADKEKLCESLSWMEADDIELNFTDLKTLFRLAQDILKYKSEQANNVLGQLETFKRKNGKKTNTVLESPSKSTDSVLETIANQEEIIKANKEILGQLYADIAELKARKNKLEEDKTHADKDSESSRDALSELDAITQLENEVTMKNKHIRKLLSDVKILEEENLKLKEKVSTIKDKLTEATQIIENLTEQLFSINSENHRLKESLGKSERSKAQLTTEIEYLRKELFEKASSRENIYEEIKTKVQHWKNVVRAKKTEIEKLSNENAQLKADLIQASQQMQHSSPKEKKESAEELKIKELQDKLSEAANEIIQSANMIELLRTENIQLRGFNEEVPDCSVSDTKNESDDGKERALINKLKKKNKSLTVALQGAEEMISVREKELTEITSQLQLLKSNDGIDTLIEGLKSKKRQLKLKDEGIKTLVQEVNTLSEKINSLELENEAMRLKLNIPLNGNVSTKGIVKKYRIIEENFINVTKALKKTENKLVSVELENRSSRVKISKLIKLLTEMGCSKDKIEDIIQCKESDHDFMPADGGGEASTLMVMQARHEPTNENWKEEMKELAEENEGLRKGLQEILDVIKDNRDNLFSKTSSNLPSCDNPIDPDTFPLSLSDLDGTALPVPHYNFLNYPEIYLDDCGDSVT